MIIAFFTQTFVVAAGGEDEVEEALPVDVDDDATGAGYEPPGGKRTAPTVIDGLVATAKSSTLLLFFR